MLSWNQRQRMRDDRRRWEREAKCRQQEEAWKAANKRGGGGNPVFVYHNNVAKLREYDLDKTYLNVQIGDDVEVEGSTVDLFVPWLGHFPTGEAVRVFSDGTDVFVEVRVFTDEESRAAREACPVWDRPGDEFRRPKTRTPMTIREVLEGKPSTTQPRRSGGPRTRRAPLHNQTPQPTVQEEALPAISTVAETPKKPAKHENPITERARRLDLD